jgi:hypothetical protein
MEKHPLSFDRRVEDEFSKKILLGDGDDWNV